MKKRLATARAYARLTKPGVTAGNVLTAVAGYFLATSVYGFGWKEFIGMLIGQILVIGGACALNNYLDRDIDSKMTRTKSRPSVSGNLSPIGMQLFAWSLFAVGTAVLYATTNLLTVAIGILGFVTYVWLYGALAKRKSIHGMAVGAIPGALPIAGGYAAASGMIDPGMIVVFLIIFFWQFPEFYPITIYRRKEYKAAGIPAMPVVMGVRSTIIQIFVYTVLYVTSTLALVPLGYTGATYGVVMAAAGLYWIYIGYQGLKTSDNDADKWARKMFRGSMMTILLVCLMLSIGPLLP